MPHWSFTRHRAHCPEMKTNNQSCNHLLLIQLLHHHKHHIIHCQKKASRIIGANELCWKHGKHLFLYGLVSYSYHSFQSQCKCECECGMVHNFHQWEGIVFCVNTKTTTYPFDLTMFRGGVLPVRVCAIDGSITCYLQFIIFCGVVCLLLRERITALSKVLKFGIGKCNTK